jgi:site-specific DNA recombinase
VKRGRNACRTDSLPAHEIENAVVDQIRCIGQDPALLGDTLDATRERVDQEIGRLASERRAVERGLVRLQAEIRRAAGADGDISAQLLDLNNQVGAAERRISEIAARVAELEAERTDASDVAAALGDFDNVWHALSPREQARVLHLLVQLVEFDATAGALDITFHPTGIRALAGELAQDAEEAA